MTEPALVFLVNGDAPRGVCRRRAADVGVLARGLEASAGAHGER